MDEKKKEKDEEIAKFKDENQEIKVSLLDKLAEEKKKLEELENNHQDQLNIYKII